MSSQSTRTYFRNFFAEKDIPYTIWEINTSTDVHIISSEDIAEILQQLPANTSEARRIRDTLMVLDFHNTSPLRYLEALAEAYVRTAYPDTAYAAR